MKYKFQFQNGNITEGVNTLFVKDGIAEVETADLTPAMILLIEAHGGQLVEEKSEPKRKRKVKPKPIKFGEEEATSETLAIFDKVKDVIDKVK